MFYVLLCILILYSNCITIFLQEDDIPELDELSENDVDDNEEMEEIKNELPTDPLMHAYSKQLQANTATTTNTTCDDNVSSSKINQQNRMDDEATDFFSNLNKITSLPHHSSFHSYQKSEYPKNEIIPTLEPSNPSPSNASSGVFSSGATPNGGSRLEVTTSLSSDLVFIPNTITKDKETVVGQNCDDAGIETIELVNETKKSLLVEVSFIFEFNNYFDCFHF